MLKDEETKTLVLYLDSLLKKSFETVFVREFPTYWRYTIGETMLAVIWFKKGTVELGALKVKSPKEWDSNLQGSKYVGLKYSKLIESKKDAQNAVKDILLNNNT